MKKSVKCIIAIIMIIAVISLVGCSENEQKPNGDPNGNNNIIGDNNNTSEEIDVPSADGMFTDADKKQDYDRSDLQTITLSGDSVTTQSTNVTVEEGFITISGKGTYFITGNGTNQTIIVDADEEKPRIVLSSLTINNSEYASIYVKSADKVFIILEGENTLITTTSLKSIGDQKVDGVIYSKDDLAIKGDGSLTISSPKHGIVGNDDLKITGGTINVTASNHAIKANDSVRITGANIATDSGKDGIHVENEEDSEKGYFYMESGSIKATSKGDGIDASSTVQILGGSFDITTTGDDLSDTSTKGIKSDLDMLISDATIVVSSYDDSIHSNSSIKIQSGTLTLSSGDDGIHADSSLVITGGDISITKSYEGLEGQNISISGGAINIVASDDGINSAGGNDTATEQRPGQGSFNSSLNCFIEISGGEIIVNAQGDGIDSNGSILVTGGTTIIYGPTSGGDGALDYETTGTITGGTFVAIGSQGMAMNFTSATQGSILVTVGNQKAGSSINIKNSNGETLFEVATSAKTYASVLISAPRLTQGESYTITAGTYSQTIKLSSLIYDSSNGMGGGMGGHGPGGMWRP